VRRRWPWDLLVTARVLRVRCMRWYSRARDHACMPRNAQLRSIAKFVFGNSKGSHDTRGQSTGPTDVRSVLPYATITRTNSQPLRNHYATVLTRSSLQKENPSPKRSHQPRNSTHSNFGVFVYLRIICRISALHGPFKSRGSL
jgi:hypothetical protein